MLEVVAEPCVVEVVSLPEALEEPQPARRATGRATEARRARIRLGWVLISSNSIDMMGLVKFTSDEHR
jgi:hypothetical protein